MVVGRLVSYWGGNFSGAMLNFGRVDMYDPFFQFGVFQFGNGNLMKFRPIGAAWGNYSIFSIWNSEVTGGSTVLI